MSPLICGTIQPLLQLRKVVATDLYCDAALYCWALNCCFLRM